MSSVTVDGSLTRAEIAAKYNPGYPNLTEEKKQLSQSLIGGVPDTGKNALIVPKEIFDSENEFRQWGGAIKPVNNIGRIFIHEAGNLASYHIFGDFYVFGNGATGFGGDPDSGEQISQCVFGNPFPPNK